MGDAGIREEVLLAAPGQVDGISGRRGVRQRRREVPGELRRQERQLEPGGRRHVARDRPVAAAVADDGHPRARQRPGSKEGLGQVDHLTRRRHEIRPGRAAGGLDDRDVAHERARVRYRGPDAGVASPDGEQDDRGRCSGRRVDERPAVAEVLGVDSDQLGALVSGE